MPSQGNLVCGVQCKTEQEIIDLYASLGETVIDASDSSSLPLITLRDIQIDILERISNHSREELEKIVEGGTGREYKISRMNFGPIGDEGEMGHEYPQDFVFGVELTSRYSPVLLDHEFPHGLGGIRLELDLEQLNFVRGKIRERIPNAQIYTIDMFY